MPWTRYQQVIAMEDPNIASSIIRLASETLSSRDGADDSGNEATAGNGGHVHDIKYPKKLVRRNYAGFHCYV